jgi:hypothetical protein
MLTMVDAHLIAKLIIVIDINSPKFNLLFIDIPQEGKKL